MQRRNFLKLLGLGVGAAMLPAVSMNNKTDGYVNFIRQPYDIGSNLDWSAVMTEEMFPNQLKQEKI